MSGGGVPNRDLASDGDVGSCTGGGGPGGGEGRMSVGVLLFRCLFTAFFSLAAFGVLCLLIGVVAVTAGVFSSSRVVSIPTECRVISSGVDLRSSKVCELGVSNYKARHVFYPSEKRRVWCRDDYYWASVFQVEYKEFFSGRMLHAVAEAPREALPLDCRPSFGTAWLTKSRFKVNETYHCKYTPGRFKADFQHDDLFNCRAKDPSFSEIIKRLLILFLELFSLDKGKGRHILDVLSGIVSGTFFPWCLIIIIKSARFAKLAFATKWSVVKHRINVLAAKLRRACVLVVYLSAVSWLALRYIKAIGLKQLLFDPSLGRKEIER